MQARDGLEQLLLAGAGDARDAEDLAAHGGKRHVVELLHALGVKTREVLHREARHRIFIPGPVDVQGDRAADHHVGQGLRVRLRGVDRANVLALAENGDLVGQGHDLVQLVGNDDDGLAVGAHVAQHLEELVRLLRGQNSGRLVQNQDVGPAVENLDDLNGLLLRDGHVVDLLGRVDVESVPVADLLNPFVGRSHIELLPLVESKDDIFRGGEYVDQLVVLVDHADLVVECVLRAADRDRLSADQDLAVVGEVDACEHIHQRGLAAAVFAEQGQNLAVIDRQVDPVVGDNRAKTLGDVSQFNRANSFQGCHPFFSGCEHLIMVILL